MSKAERVIDSKIEDLSEDISDKFNSQGKMITELRRFINAGDAKDIIGAGRCMIDNIAGIQREIDALHEQVRMLVWLKEDMEK